MPHRLGPSPGNLPSARFRHRLSFIDRFAYPQFVARGHGYLIPNPVAPGYEAEATERGWQIKTDPAPVTGVQYGRLTRNSRWRLIRISRVVTLSSTARFERRIRLNWWGRLMMWGALAVGGFAVIGLVGIAPGVGAALIAEVLLSYRYVPRVCTD